MDEVIESLIIGLPIFIVIAFLYFQKKHKKVRSGETTSQSFRRWGKLALFAIIGFLFLAAIVMFFAFILY